MVFIVFIKTYSVACAPAVSVFSCFGQEMYSKKYLDRANEGCVLKSRNNRDSAL